MTTFPLREEGVSWVYVFSAGDSVCKVGYAVDIEKRIARVRSTRAFAIDFYCAYGIDAPPAGALIQRAEFFSHRELRGRRINGEWFFVTPQEAEVAVRRAMGLLGVPLVRFPVLP